MGLLLEGKWVREGLVSTDEKGRFQRNESRFRDWITPDGAPGPSGEGGFAAESGRYHLYVSLACPWAHRTLIFRALKDLEPHISVDVVHPDMLDNGWEFRSDGGRARGDSLYGCRYLYKIYQRADPKVTTRVTVPVLWDRERETIVSNESSEIIRMFNSAFDHITGNRLDFWPEALRAAIEPVNARIYETVNNGVYRAGFATTQEAYDEAATELFDSLDWLEDRLAGQRYLMGARITEADWRLFTTLVRFDAVYHTHFKCNRRRIVDHPALWAYARELYQWPRVADTVDMGHITRHYYCSHESINPHRIVPLGPVLDWAAPHGREALPADQVARA